MDTTPQPQLPDGHPWLTVPIAIIFGAVMVSLSILFVGSGGTASLLKAAQGTVANPTDTPVVVKDPKSLFGADDPALGNPGAKVTIVEFSDFQCPYCRQFFVDTFGQLKKDYIDTGKVRFIHRSYPLPFHPAARPAALASACANAQGKFWQYYDMIFSQQQKREPDPTAVTQTLTFGTADLKTWASQIGLNMTQFNQCLDSGQYGAKVDADIKAGGDVGVNGTPTFFVNGKTLVGAQPYSVFKAAIDAAL